ncbi:MAG: SBBP repeat-containing protein [Ignavibacteria bacterium]|nr:SBBP repeat-containing protein [Ignavibacteria bacterium]
MFRLITVLVFICLISATGLVSKAQVTAQWTSVYNGVSSDTDEVADIAVDNSGFVYVTGFSKSFTGGKDIVTLKYDPQGNQVWQAVYNNSSANGNDIPTSVFVDNSGNVYVTGKSEGAGSFYDIITIKYSSSGGELWNDRYNGEGNDVDCGNALGIDLLGNIIVAGYSVGAGSSEDFTTIKYSPSGSRLWIAKYNEPVEYDIDIATSLVTDIYGNVYVAGYSNGFGTMEDIAVVKYDLSGNEIWVERYNGAGNSYDITTGIAIDQNFNIFVSGYTNSASGSEDYLLLKIGADGNIIWNRTFDGTSAGYDITCGLVVDASGNCTVSGYSFNTDSGEDYVTIKYDAGGAVVWRRDFNGAGSSFDIAAGIAQDNSGSVYVTGYSYSENTFEDYATVKYDADGNLQWTQLFNGTAGDADIANSIAVDAQNNVYVSGFSYEGATGEDYITLKYSQTVGIGSSTSGPASGFSLDQNYPNPFNPSTMITYELPVSAKIVLEVYNSAGIRVGLLQNARQMPGTHSVKFNSAGLPSGVYYYRLSAADERSGVSFSETRKMVLIK